MPKGELYNSDILKGTFDGQNHTLGNFKIQAQNNTGLFAQTESAVIRNLRLADVQIVTATHSNISAIAGISNNTVIDNVHVSTPLKHQNAIQGVDHVAGLVAHDRGNTTITNSSFNGTIQSFGQNTANGGIAGIAAGNITNCFSIGSAVSPNTAGGIAGYALKQT